MTDAARQHRAEVNAWRRRRYAALRRPIGWLSLAGLDWLVPGENRMGSDRSNQVVLPSGPGLAGRLVVEDGHVTAWGQRGAGLTADGRVVRALPLVADVDAPRDDGATMLALGRLRMCVIRRGERLGLRTWDTGADALRSFGGIPHFGVDLAWRLEGRIEPPEQGATFAVPDVLGDVAEEPSAGSVAFAVEGKTHRLQALDGGEKGELWLVFGDTTNGVETYGGGRFLYTDAPDASGLVVVDFNRAYNPPCVFSPFATCPLPWAANRLPIRIQAGEQFDLVAAYSRETESANERSAEAAPPTFHSPGD